MLFGNNFCKIEFKDPPYNFNRLNLSSNFIYGSIGSIFKILIGLLFFGVMSYVTRFTSSVNQIRYCFSVILVLRIGEVQLFKLFLSAFLQIYRFSFDSFETAVNGFAAIVFMSLYLGLYIFFFIKFTKEKVRF